MYNKILFRLIAKSMRTNFTNSMLEYKCEEKYETKSKNKQISIDVIFLTKGANNYPFQCTLIERKQLFCWLSRWYVHDAVFTVRHSKFICFNYSLSAMCSPNDTSINIVERLHDTSPHRELERQKQRTQRETHSCSVF